MPTVKDTAELLKLKAKIEGLSAADQLRLCAGLLDEGKYDIAETLTGNVVDALRTRRLLQTPREHIWDFYANRSFCRRCGVQIGSDQPCR